MHLKHTYMLGILLLLIISTLIKFQLVGYPAVSHHYAYSQRFDPVTHRVKVSTIDTRTDAVTQEANISADLGLRIIGTDGLLYLSFHKQFLGDLGDRIALFNPRLGKIVDTIRLPVGPGAIRSIENNGIRKVYVLVSSGGENVNSNRSYIAILDGNPLRIKKTIVADPPPWNLAFNMCSNWTKTRIYAIEEYLGGGPNIFTGRLIIVDSSRDNLLKTINLDKRYIGYLEPIASQEGKLYLPAAGKDDKPQSGKVVLVYDAQSVILRKRIQLAGIPNRSAYLPSMHKIYIKLFGSYNGIAVIDTRNDAIVRYIAIANPKDNLASQYIGSISSLYAVAPNKIYVTGNWGDKDKPGIQVLDARTDQFIKFIPGEFGNIAVPPLQWL